MKRIKNRFPGFAIALAVSCSLFSCTQENYDDQVLVTKDMLDASFSADLMPNESNTYQITTTTRDNVISDKWDIGDGTGYVRGKDAFDLFLPDAGDYTIKHKVIGAGGIISDEAVVTITVETSDPIAGNLVKGGKFATDEDIARWTIGGTGSTDGTWTFGEGKATLNASGWAGRGIYQPIEVEAGRSYQINMFAGSTSGCVDTWFEVYCGYANPATVSGDYKEGGALLKINTWDGTGKIPFAGKITDVGSTTDANGVFSATETGTVYLVIRGGGSNMGDGISITNIEFRGISQ